MVFEICLALNEWVEERMRGVLWHRCLQPKGSGVPAS